MIVTSLTQFLKEPKYYIDMVNKGEKVDIVVNNQREVVILRKEEKEARD